MKSEELIYGDRHRAATFGAINLIIPLVILVLGLSIRALFLVSVGFVLFAFNWFTTPFNYQIYKDHLVISYGRPRRVVIPLGQISGVELLSVVRSAVINVRRKRGGRVILQPSKPEEFHERLQESWNSYLREHPEERPPEEPAR